MYHSNSWRWYTYDYSREPAEPAPRVKERRDDFLGSQRPYDTTNAAPAKRPKTKEKIRVGGEQSDRFVWQAMPMRTLRLARPFS